MEVTTETVQAACRAAYKKGLVDAAQQICDECKGSRPVRSDQYFYHPTYATACKANPILWLLEAAGGWSAPWPGDASE